MLINLRILLFALRLLSMRDTVLTPATALEASRAMHAAARGDITVEVLAAKTWNESRFNPAVFNHAGNWHCGLTQLEAGSWRRCRAIMSQRFGVYPATVARIEAGRAACIKRRGRRAGTLECALASYAIGAAGERRGTCADARHILRLAARLAWRPPPTPGV